MRALNLTLFAMILVLMLVMANVYDYHAIERLYLPGWAAFLCVVGIVLNVFALIDAADSEAESMSEEASHGK